MLDKYRAAIAAHLRKYLPPSVTVYELGNSVLLYLLKSIHN